MSAMRKFTSDTDGRVHCVQSLRTADPVWASLCGVSLDITTAPIFCNNELPTENFYAACRDTRVDPWRSFEVVDMIITVGNVRHFAAVTEVGYGPRYLRYYLGCFPASENARTFYSPFGNSDNVDDIIAFHAFEHQVNCIACLVGG